MSRLAIPELEAFAPETRHTLETMGASLGQIGNFSRLLAQDVDLLTAVSGLQATLRQHFDAQTWSRIALAVSDVNGCEYCLAFHSYTARFVAKLDDDEIDDSRRGRARDVRQAAILRFARKVARDQGRTSDADLAQLRSAGLPDVQIVRLVTTVAFFTLASMVNNVAQTDSEFSSLPIPPIPQ